MAGTGFRVKQVQSFLTDALTVRVVQHTVGGCMVLFRIVTKASLVALCFSHYGVIVTVICQQRLSRTATGFMCTIFDTTVISLATIGTVEWAIFGTWPQAHLLHRLLPLLLIWCSRPRFSNQLRSFQNWTLAKTTKFCPIHLGPLRTETGTRICATLIFMVGSDSWGKLAQEWRTVAQIIEVVTTISVAHITRDGCMVHILPCMRERLPVLFAFQDCRIVTVDTAKAYKLRIVARTMFIG